MTPALRVRGWSVLSAAGEGAPAIAAAVDAAGRGAVRGAGALADFDIRARLGRKGTSFFDRWTALSVAATGCALDDAGVAIDDDRADSIGIVIGTTAGSLSSTMEFTQETLVQDRPYLVNPALFPNTVMNCAAGQCAIWYGLRGVNATIAGGGVAFVNALRYAATVLGAGYADTLVVAAVEELTEHSASIARVLYEDSAPSEGVAAFVVDLGDGTRGGTGPRDDAEILACSTRFAPDAADLAPALARCTRAVLEKAEINPAQVDTIVTTGHSTGAEETALDRVGVSGERLRVTDTFGDTGAAAGALALAAVLARHRVDASRDGQVALITASTPEGSVGAVVTRGWSGGSIHHR